MEHAAARALGSSMPAPPGRRQLLAFTEDRTLWLQADADGRAVVRKVFVRGTAADAELEAHLGAHLRGPGFVDYLGAEPDPETGRPSTLTLHVPANDLRRIIETSGPLAPRTVAALGVALCRVLRRLHALAVHRDIKPSNVLVQINDAGLPDVTLLDAEHAWLLRSAPPSGPFTGGTHGWSPPESYAGATPSPAFDVFGLGATLWYASAGWPPWPQGDTLVRSAPRPRHLDGLPPGLVDVLYRCLRPDPRERAALADVEASLETWLTEHPTDHRAASKALQALQRGDLAAASTALTQSDAGGSAADLDWQTALRATLHRRLLLLARRTLPPEQAPNERTSLAELAAEARRLYAFARRFPAHLGLRQAIARVRAAVANAIEGLPSVIAAHKRAAEFDAAQRELAAAAAAIAATAPLGGPTPRLPDGTAPGALQRSPHRLVALAQDDLAAARHKHDALLADLAKAEGELDVSGAAQAIDHAAAVYGGASAVVANLKDRLHRLTFFVERLAQPSDTLTPLHDELLASGNAVDLSPVAQCLERCRRQSHGSRAPKSTPGLRALLRALQEPAEELAATAAVLTPAITALASALDRSSLLAWTIADDCRAKLASVPIPIRPLQNQIARLDHLRLLDALIDSARGSRSDLLDELERLRSEIDQARTTRDRIASGARAAMERGHLTTALYDMARAVDRYDAPAGELEAARKRKDAVEAAVRENHRLAARYAELEDDPTSEMDQRVEVLNQRLAVLSFLSENVAAERATHYTQDRLDVEVRILQERTAAAERDLDTLGDPQARSELAVATLRAIDEFVRARGEERDRLVGRVQRMREHWDSLQSRAHEDVARADAARREARRRRGRSLLARGLVLALAAALAISLFFLLRSREVDPLGTAADRVRDQLTAPVTQDEFDPVLAVIALDRFAGDLERSGLARSEIAGAEDVVRATRAWVDNASAAASGNVAWPTFASDLQRLRSDFERARTRLAPPAGSDTGEIDHALVRFLRAAEMSAVLLAQRACPSDAERETVRRYAQERKLDVQVR